jgi:hypothetical protein
MGTFALPAAQGKGRGNRVRNSCDYLIEVGVTIAALRRGIAPKDLAELVGRRKELKRAYRAAYLEESDPPPKADWSKSRAQAVPLLKTKCFFDLNDWQSR